MNDYKPNSHRFKEEQKAAASEEKRVEKVVSGAVKTKKRSEIRKFTDVFVAEDAQNVKSYIIGDVLIPAFKKAVSDAITSGVDMILYGSTGRSERRSSTSRVSYRQYYDNREDDRRSYDKTRFEYDDIEFTNRGEAETVLDEMLATIERYGVVTVADMYDMVGLRPPYTSHKFGWTHIRNVNDIVTRVRGGYILKLPRAMPLD